ncbi:MAG: M23 family metallopeptidase [Pseudomonadota bacterium]
MAGRYTHAFHSRLERLLPEQRLFLRSDTETRYVRLTPMTQLIALSGSAMLIGWAIVASAILLMDSLGAGNYRDQALRDKAMFEERLNTLSVERDTSAEEAAAAHDRFALALEEVSLMQARILAAEERRKELETGMTALRATLRTAIAERDAKALKVDELSVALAETESSVAPELAAMEELEATVDALTAALSNTAGARDDFAGHATEVVAKLDDMELEQKLKDERNDRIFQQLEEAVSISLEPLDDMFQQAGLPADSIIETVRRGYSGQGGPMTPLTLSTKSGTPSPESLRANGILERLDRLNLYRIAVQKTPFAMPVNGAYRFTSGFGPRWGRMHNGADFASSHGTPVYSTADGVVTHAGWEGGYGRLIRIRHDFGFETRYAHLARIRVNVGDRVSRGERIGDMGNSGNSTGTHLHYEVRIEGNPKNPMTYIKAARDVF